MKASDLRDSPLARRRGGGGAEEDCSAGETPIWCILRVGGQSPTISFFSSFFTPTLGGELVGYEAKLATFFRDTVRIPQILESFSDIRKHPRIRLRDILMCVFLMPVWGMTALLRLDYHLRTPKQLRLFRCPEGKKIVISDTTIARVLRWIDPEQSSETLFAPCSALNAKGTAAASAHTQGTLQASGRLRWLADG